MEIETALAQICQIARLRLEDGESTPGDEVLLLVDRRFNRRRYDAARTVPLVDELIDTIGERYRRPVIGVGHSLGGFLTALAAWREAFPEPSAPAIPPRLPTLR